MLQYYTIYVLIVVPITIVVVKVYSNFIFCDAYAILKTHKIVLLVEKMLQVFLFLALCAHFYVYPVLPDR